MKAAIEKWIEIIADGPPESKDLAALCIIEAGSPGLSEEGAPVETGKLVSFSRWKDETREEAPAGGVSLKGYISSEDPKALDRLSDELKRIGWTLSASPYREKDWTEKWKAGIKPVRITVPGASITIRPSWKAVKKRAGDIVIEIDPGMAFGTGSHATTKMCLRAMAGLLKGPVAPERCSLLDVGTGTGVLAIAAKRLRAKKAVGIDIDPVAVKVARKNAVLNNAAVKISTCPLDGIKGAYTIVVANILAGDLVRLKDQLFNRVASGGYLILSGLLKEESAGVEGEFRASGLKAVKKYSSGEWAALVLSRP